MINLEKNEIELILTSPMSLVSVDQKENKSIGLGTGEKYIRARLTQSFGKNWLFEQMIISAHWQTRLVMPRVIDEKNQVPL